MFKFLLTLHVLAAVLLIGPFVLAAFSGHRAIRRRDADATRRAARTMGLFAGGSLLVALLGFAVLGVTDRFTFRTPWIIISITLWVVAMAIGTGYTTPALRRAGKVIAASPPPTPILPLVPEPDGDTTDDDTKPEIDPTLTPLPPAGDPGTRERLEQLAGKIIGSGTIVFLAFVCITVLMVVRPFGR